MQKQLIVIGGGAAGFFCAVNAARMNPLLQVLLLEKSNKLLAKVKISGGGRCNVTHACFDRVELGKNYPRGGNFMKKAFHQFFTTDTVSWFEERGVTLKTESDGRMFPSTNTSQTIVDCLLKEAAKYGVQITMQAEVRIVTRKDNGFDISLANGAILEADYLCVACGGYPKLSMFEWLCQTGHTVEEPVPSLFTFNMPGHPIRELMGVSLEKVRIKIIGKKLEQEGPVLITHWGLSGPAVLKLSAWGARELALDNYDFKMMINWLPDYNEQQLAAKLQTYRQVLASQKVGGRNPFGLPQRLWEFLVRAADIAEATRWANLPAKETNKLVKNICAGEFAIKGKTTFKEEFVTAGGIRLNEIDHTCMMSKKTVNLFFAGEILDVDGVTGGFNFQHAWTSGFIAGKAIATLSQNLQADEMLKA